MKILLISDIEQPQYWLKNGPEPSDEPEILSDIDLILSAGDLKPVYLSGLAAAAQRAKKRPLLLYVHGNHDALYAKYPPKSCVCVDGDLLTVKGLRILGLGGSVRYRGGPHQYTEEEMSGRILELGRKLQRSGGADIVLNHAPPLGFGDGENTVHRGFVCFRTLMDEIRPKYLIHGHVHLQGDSVREHRYGDTTVINACGSYILEVQP